MFEAPRQLIFVNESPSRDVPNKSSASRGIYSKSQDVEKGSSPYSLPSAGSTNVSIAETLNDEEGGCSQSRPRRYFLANVDKQWTDIILIVCGFVSGFVDGLSFTFWSSFSSMQTGRLRFSYFSFKMYILTLIRKPNQPRPRCLRQPPPPRQTVAQSPNRHLRLPPRHLLLHRHLLAPQPPPPHNPNSLLHPPNNPPPNCRASRPNRRNRRNTQRRPNPLATRRRHRPRRLPSGRADPRVQVPGIP